MNYDALDSPATLEVTSKITKQWGYRSSLQGLDQSYLSPNPKCSNQDNDYYANTKPNDKLTGNQIKRSIDIDVSF